MFSSFFMSSWPNCKYVEVISSLECSSSSDNNFNAMALFDVLFKKLIAKECLRTWGCGGLVPTSKILASSIVFRIMLYACCRLNG